MQERKVKDTKEEFKTTEEIRVAQGVNQTVWAQMLGSTYRTYQGRLQGVQPKWLVSEIVAAGKYNNGKVKLTIADKTYNITIEEVR